MACRRTAAVRRGPLGEGGAAHSLCSWPSGELKGEPSLAHTTWVFTPPQGSLHACATEWGGVTRSLHGFELWLLACSAILFSSLAGTAVPFGLLRGGWPCLGGCLSFFRPCFPVGGGGQDTRSSVSRNLKGQPVLQAATSCLARQGLGSPFPE